LTERAFPAADVLVRNLARKYRVGDTDVTALQAVDLEVASGEFLAVVGVSGSGKSTLLHLLGGLDTPTSGDLVVAGHRLNQLSNYDRSLYRRKVVGFVFQSFYLLPHLTALRNVALALTLQGIYGDRRLELATRALDRVGLASRAGHRPGQLSGGEQQRVAVARAIAHQPRLLLADEPTGNLDQATAAGLMELIRDINRSIATTVILVTHDEELVSHYCDRMVRLRDGRLLIPTEQAS
jgi:ABC-type lipoprotein export system ATPase subunit